MKSSNLKKNGSYKNYSNSSSNVSTNFKQYQPVLDKRLSLCNTLNVKNSLDRETDLNTFTNNSSTNYIKIDKNENLSINNLNEEKIKISSDLPTKKTSVCEFDRNKRKISAILSLKNETWGEENEIKKSLNQKELIKQKIQEEAKKKSISKFTKFKKLISNERNRTKFYIIFLAILILSMVICSNFLEKDSKIKEGEEYRILFKQKDSRMFDLLDDNRNKILSLHYGINIPRNIKPIKCTKLSKDGKTSYLCRDWLYRASLSIGIQNKPNRINCYSVEWRSYTSKEVLKDCIELKNGYWFGMGHIRNSPWPLNEWKQKMAPFVTSASMNEESPFGSIIRRYWISSDGISISVPLDIPLHVSFNETLKNGKPSNQMCFQANLAHFPYDAETSVKLEYSICTGDNLKVLHTDTSKGWSQSSVSFDLNKSPEMEFIRKPIWVTNHLPHLNKTEIHKFTKKINDVTNVTGFLLIDTRWESILGELQINQTNFPSAIDTFKAITNRGWKTILTVTPFINIVANMLLEASYHKRIILDRSLQVPLLTKCSPEENLKFCAVLDIMKPLNGEWFKRRLTNNIINKYSIEALMFQGIEVSRMPQYHHNQLHNIINPDYYQVYYIDIAASTSKYVGMTTAAGIKDVQGFLRIPLLENSWEALNSIIPTVLNLGLVGFSIINTGSIGGDILKYPKDDELFIRWLELSLFLPITQFSKVEDISSLNLKSIKIFKKYQHIRKTDLLPVMERCMIDNNQNGWPIIRPLFWLEPDDQDLYLIKDQFAIGDEIIVAPILNKGQTKRNITLPSGIWQDMITLKNEKGGKTLQNYEIGLNQIPYFKKVKDF